MESSLTKSVISSFLAAFRTAFLVNSFFIGSSYVSKDAKNEIAISVYSPGNAIAA